MLHVGRPTLTQLKELCTPHEHAVTVYQPVDPPQDGGTAVPAVIAAQLAEALHELAGAGVDASVLRAVEDRVTGLPPAEGEGHCLAVFATPDAADAYLLPDHLAAEHRIGRWFDLGPLVRAVSSPQTVYGLTLSEDEWALWWASGSAPVQNLLRSSRSALGLLAPGLRHALFRVWLSISRSPAYVLDRDDYLDGVAGTASRRLDALDPDRSAPVFLLATDPLGPQLAARLGRSVEVVAGDPSGLRASEVGRALRERATVLVRRRLSERLGMIRDETSTGLPSSDLDEVARAVRAGLVDLLVYDTSASVWGEVTDDRVRLDPSGYDLLARLAIDVLAGGGEVLAMDPDEAHSRDLDGPVFAHLTGAPPGVPDDAWPALGGS